MTDLGSTMAWLGALLTLAIAAEWLGDRLPLPRVSILLLVGVLVGPPVLDLLPETVLEGEELATSLALTIIAFLLGSEFESERLREQGRAILLAAVIGAVLTAVVVAVGLVAAGWDVQFALALGGIATATAPAATRVVISDERADGPMTRTLLGVIAMLDAIGIVLFSLLLAVGGVLTGGGAGSGLLAASAREIGGGVLLGAVVGLPAAWLASRLRSGDPVFLESLAIVLVIAGLGTILEVSSILGAVVAGAIVVNLAHLQQRPFRAIEGVQWPFLAVFFIYGGAALDLAGLQTYTALTVAYIALRVAGKILGGYLGGWAAGLDRRRRAWLGPSLMPQAGVALGLALLARDRVPELAETIVPVVVASTVLFELVGPIVTRIALHRTGEARSNSDGQVPDVTSSHAESGT